MILIVGSTKDDTLYFDSVMTGKRKETLFGRYELTFGNIFNQEVILLSNVYTSYISSVCVSHLLEKYFIILVFVVGKATAYTPDLNIGDIILSRRVFVSDVDLIEETNSKLGQIPGFPSVYESPIDVIQYANAAFESRTMIPHKTGTIISSNTSYSNDAQIKPFNVENQLFGHNRCVAFDTISGGVAIACNLFNVPFISTKVISRRFGNRQSAKDYSNVLKNYAAVGKGIVNTIGDIGRNDVLRGGE